MATFFQKLRNLGNSDKEDYLTEIFAYAIQNDLLFRNNFLSLLKCKIDNSFSINTQIEYEVEYINKGNLYKRLRRPDIEINLENAVILVECKVDSEEGEDQLFDYAKILLEKQGKNKTLVYLTKKIDDKNFDDLKNKLKIFYKILDKEKREIDELKFIALRWFNIESLINDKCNFISKELKQYLLKEKIVMEKIGYEDIVAFKVFIETSQKMNEILKEVSRKVSDKDVKLHTYNNFTPVFQKMEYIIRFNYKNKFDICFGFCNWWNEHPYVFVRLYIPLDNDKNSVEKITNTLNPNKNEEIWEYDKNQDSIGYRVEIKKKLVDFICYDKDTQQEKIIEFFSNCIESLVKIKSYLGMEELTQ
jgi:PD-(D/E)XK nuclease superfamily